MKIWMKFRNAWVIWWWALTNPKSLEPSNFKMLSDLFILIMKVAETDRHMMTHIAYIHPDEGEKQIVSIWAGAGAAAEPTKRIAELLAENSRLKTLMIKEGISIE